MEPTALNTTPVSSKSAPSSSRNRPLVCTERTMLKLLQSDLFYPLSTKPPIPPQRERVKYPCHFNQEPPQGKSTNRLPIELDESSTIPDYGNSLQTVRQKIAFFSKEDEQDLFDRSLNLNMAGITDEKSPKKTSTPITTSNRSTRIQFSDSLSEKSNASDLLISAKTSAVAGIEHDVRFLSVPVNKSPGGAATVKSSPVGKVCGKYKAASASAESNALANPKTIVPVPRPRSAKSLSPVSHYYRSECNTCPEYHSRKSPLPAMEAALPAPTAYSQKRGNSGADDYEAGGRIPYYWDRRDADASYIYLSEDVQDLPDKAYNSLNDAEVLKSNDSNVTVSEGRRIFDI